MKRVANPSELIPADPEFRRRVSIGIAAAAVLGFSLIYWVTGKLDEIGMRSAENTYDAIAQIERLIIYSGIGSICLTVVLAAWLIRIATRVLAENRFPPQGMKVIRDTPIRRGTTARMIGIAGLLIAVLVVGSNAVWFVLLAMVKTLG